MPGCAALVRRGWDTDLAQHVAPTRHVRVQQEVLYRFPTEMEPGQHWGNTTSRNRQRQPTAANQQLWL